MEAAEVDQAVGAEKEVGDDGSDGVQLSWRRGKTEGDSKKNDLRETWFKLLCVFSGLETWVKLGTLDVDF